jgi:5-formaminoimidazole-4-carboxamide-1-(beta)-D-ribofuranosyl 5'-monophosphate synthetase
VIHPDDVRRIVDGYDTSKVTIGTLGSHSALDIADGAKDEGFQTVVVCQRGRELPYLRYRRIVDKVILLEKFSDIMAGETLASLLRLNTIFVPHRAFTTYVPYDAIEDRFAVPLFGSRSMLRTEERTSPRNQYFLLDKAGIRYPRRFSSPSEIDRLAIVKVQEAKRKIERAFFTAMNKREFDIRAQERIAKGIITADDLEKAVIEEFVVGTYFNFNYFHSVIRDEVEFMGVDRRLQTNLHDFVSLPAKQQLESDVILQNVEIGHMGATVRESLLEKVLRMGDDFAMAAEREFPPGIVGPFALQGAVTAEQDIVIFDVSPRVPGSPVIGTTSPYTKYAYGKSMSVGRRIALELKEAIQTGRVGEIIT